ncbi:hypothetical protein K491DRAFT_590792 [Lophiostoma macrostomum CBS 122681]|uniref:Vacuolar segregation subunit 7-domain-containing protein n=1 Tax=Lophiostoma macrostomum CBS 122681 TaxID=1314788 RepID=A0A6A6TKS1_9PLEO|nr:hypothetical protein K491DRAFT_590792 [Lophiostoma macrostomum CBS 122681]
MTSHDDFRSITGVVQSAEPAANSSPTPGTPSAQGQATGRPRQPASASASPSTANSPLSSREASRGPSPSRGSSYAGAGSTVPSAASIQRALSAANVQLPPAPSATSQDPSRVPRPSKNPGTNSGDSTPHWPVSPRLKSPPPTSDSRSRSRRNSLRTQAKKAEPSSAAPSIVVQSSSPSPASRIPVKDEGGSSDPDEQPLSMKASSRGASGAAPKLETVQEASLPTTPGFDGLEVQSAPASTNSHKSSDEERNDAGSSKVTEDLSGRTKHTESGGDNNGTHSSDARARMQDQRSASAHRPHSIPSKASYSSLSTVRSRTEAPSRNMTVETETVPSIAQATIGNQDRSASGRGEGSLRLKPSNETIRPKKDKQKPKRKAPSIHTGTGRSPCTPISYHHRRSTTASSLGSPVSRRSCDDRRPILPESPPMSELRKPSFRSTTSLIYSYSGTNMSFRKASSKADVFEQKVASAVDEANSSDSDATFIYESNPPEQQPHRSRQHHHSRTPSMTSIASLADQRSIIRDPTKNPNKKTSMKFANPYNNANADSDGLDRGDGTIRVGSGRVSAGSHHHHIGRHGQGRGALSHVLVDSDSSMPGQSSRTRGPSSRYASQPNSPRFHQFNIGNGNGNGNGNKKHSEFSTYDIDTENAADDERTPLINSVRSPRVRTPRRRNSASHLRQMERRHRRSGGWCRRFAGCLVLSILVLVLIFSAVGLVFATTKPLNSVKVREMQNVVASQQELVLDLVVEAVNPNIIGVTISDMNVSIFAKSKHVGSDKWWRQHGEHHDDQEEWVPISDKSNTSPIEEQGINGGVDEGTDPIEDPELGEPRTMLLGRIFHFDSPLYFDGSFFKRRKTESLGEMRLTNPGNKTESGGTERWEEVLQYPFELIIRGLFKYQLPLSTREHTIPVTAVYYYDPDAEKKKLKTMPLEFSAQDRSFTSTSVKLSQPSGRFARALARA